MAEEAVTEVPESVIETERGNLSTAQDMDLEAVNNSDQADGDAAANGGELNAKRGREGGDEAEKEEDGGEAKKQKVEKSVEEQRLEKLESVDGENGTGADTVTVPVSVGTKSFGSSVEMFDYFYKFLHFWHPNLNVNKYEHMVLLDLIQKGLLEPEKKIGKGIHAFQVRYHPQWKSRCFFLVREDETSDDFSFRKCVDHILPLPESMQIKPDVNKALGGGGRGSKSGGGGGRGGSRGHWRGRGRGGRPRN